MFERPQLKILLSRLEEPRKFMNVLLGPRQIGKTTIIEQMTKKVSIPVFFANADEALENVNSSWIDEQWQTVRIQMGIGQTQEYILVFDEIQNIRNWSTTVKANWDNDTRNNINIKVVILGSAQLLLNKALSESMAGRFEVLRVNHWSFKEMETAFGVTPQQYAWFGGYPGMFSLMNDEKRWKTIVNDALIETTLLKDILMMARIDKPALLRQVFDLTCLYSGQIVSYNKMVGQLQDAGNSSTLANYLHLLDAAGFVSAIPKYYKEPLHQKTSIPKLQVQNTAFIAARSRKTFNEMIAQPAEWGRVVESAVGAHLLNCAYDGGYEVYYWRERNDEVDFVLTKGDKIVALEVKSGSRNSGKGLEVFRKLYNPQMVLMVGISGMRWETFLTFNPGELF